MSERYRRLADLMELTGMLRARSAGLSIDQIADHFDVSRRTAERMLGTLRDRFPEIEPELRDGHKYWKIPRGGALTTIELPEEITTLTERVAELEAESVALDAATDPIARIAADVLDCSTVGVFILAPDFRVVWVNDAIQKYFGFTAADVVGKDKRELIRDRLRGIFEDPEEFEQLVVATYQDNTYVEHFECHVLPDEDRRERWLEHWSHPIDSGALAGGRVEHYVDLTPLYELRCTGVAPRQEHGPRTLKLIREDLATLDGIARAALESGEGAEIALDRISRMVRRMRRTATFIPLRTENDPADSGQKPL